MPPRYSWPCKRCFNPRAPAGRDLRCRRCPRGGCGFNPRAPAGRDLSSLLEGEGEGVSIHAPLRGATPSPAPQVVPIAGFNPRAPAGRDFRHPAAEGDVLQFQSTRPCGARLKPVGLVVDFPMFQSTRPCGARPIRTPLVTRDFVFQSTRPCGARRQGYLRPMRKIRVSIHAPLRGATWVMFLLSSVEAVSIHATLRGATIIPKSDDELTAVSIHAPLRGATGYHA